jgi:hypothetical protein
MVSGCNHPANFSGSQVEPVVERGGYSALLSDSFRGLCLNPICYFSQAIYSTYQHSRMNIFTEALTLILYSLHLIHEIVIYSLYALTVHSSHPGS